MFPAEGERATREEIFIIIFFIGLEGDYVLGHGRQQPLLHLLARDERHCAPSCSIASLEEEALVVVLGDVSRYGSSRS